MALTAPPYGAAFRSKSAPLSRSPSTATMPRRPAAAKRDGKQPDAGIEIEDVTGIRHRIHDPPDESRQQESIALEERRGVPPQRPVRGPSGCQGMQWIRNGRIAGSPKRPGCGSAAASSQRRRSDSLVQGGRRRGFGTSQLEVERALVSREVLSHFDRDDLGCGCAQCGERRLDGIHR